MKVVRNKGRGSERYEVEMFLMAAWYLEFAFVLQASWEMKEVKRRNEVMRKLK